MQLILGSNSPRRREILSFFNIPFQQISPDFDEEAVPFHDNPKEYVLTLARGKADSLARSFPQDAILTADTIVYKKGKIYGKPKDAIEAFENLKELSGNWHSVFTGLALSFHGKDFMAAEETRVIFNPLTEDQIRVYHSIIPSGDKAGGYMIQGPGGLIVNRIEGCYYNVVGLPINSLCSLLKEAGIDLWKDCNWLA
jgi:septum formation protein